jgi:hypothetical protein
LYQETDVAKQRPRHPNKEIEAALAYAEACGWRVVRLKGHAWGKILCQWNDLECRCGTFCQTSVWSTPRVPEDLAEKIRRVVNGCARRMGEESIESGSQPKERGGSDG